MTLTNCMSTDRSILSRSCRGLLSEAKELLEKDIDDGLHMTMIPMKLQETRPEYMAFDPDTFRGRIYQEVKRRGRKLLATLDLERSIYAFAPTKNRRRI